MNSNATKKQNMSIFRRFVGTGLSGPLSMAMPLIRCEMQSKKRGPVIAAKPRRPRRAHRPARGNLEYGYPNFFWLTRPHFQNSACLPIGLLDHHLSAYPSNPFNKHNLKKNG